MKLTFLGTRGEVKEKEKAHRYQTGLLVETETGKVLFDCGERKFLEKKLDAIFLTHAHEDHTKGLEDDIEEDVYMTERTSKALKLSLENEHRVVEREKIKLKDLELEVMAFPVLHSEKHPCVLYKVKGKDFTFVFAPDVLSIRKDEREAVFKNVDLYIGDGSSLRKNLVRREKKTGKIIGHASVKTQMGWLRDAEVKHAIFTQWGAEAIKMDERALKRVLEEMAAPDLEVEVAFDGMQWESRSSKLLAAVLPYRPKIEKKIDLIRTRDDWRIFGGWYAQLKERGKFKYSKDEILNKFLIPCLKELIRDGSTEFHPENWKKWPKEIYLEAFDKIVKKFRYLVKPHGTMIWEGKKTATVHARRFIQGAFFSIVEGDKEFGFARFKQAKPITLEQFSELKRQHRVSEEEREKWWPGKEQLYFYKIRTWIPLDKPRKVSVPKGIRTYGTRADLKEVFIDEESDRDVMLQMYDELKPKNLGKNEIITRIARHFLSIGFDLEYWKGKVEAVLERERKFEGAKKFAWECDACGFVGEATDDEMGERYNSCPVCGQIMKRIKEARHRRDQCMKCEKPPEYEVLWAEGMGRAWFCKKHLKEWIWGKKGEAKKTGFAMDVNAVKKVDSGVVGKKWADNKNADLKHNLNRIMKEQEGQIKDFEYLLHHVEIGEDGKEKIHHCFVYDHIGNLFSQGHLLVKDGKVFVDDKEVKEGLYHFISGLEANQEVAWSDEEAEKSGIKPKKMKSGMTLKTKSKEW